MAERHLESLIHGVILDGQGGGTDVWWPQIDAWRPETGVLWLHFDRAPAKTLHWLRNSSGIDPIIVDALVEEDSRPRCITIGDGLLVVLRGINLNPGADPEDMVALRIWIDGARIITTRHRKVMAAQDIRDRLAKRQGPKDAGALLVQLAELLTARMAPAIDRLDEVEDRIEDQALGASPGRVAEQLSTTRRQTIAIKRYLAPQREAVAALLTDAPTWLDAGQRLRLREVGDRVTRYIEDLDALRERASVLQDEIDNRLSIQMNKTMYLFSIVAAIILPPSFIAQVLGMSVGGIPGAGGGPAFWIIVGLLAAFVVAELLLFRRLKWI